MRVASSLLVMLLSTGCGRSCRPSASSAPADSGTIAQPKWGDGTYQAPQLEFAIESVYEHRTPSESAPFHRDGGDWTFFDARTSDGLRFSFGFQQRGPAEQVTFGRALWAVKDPEVGAALVRRFADVFHGATPAAGERHELRPKPFSLAIMGDHFARNADGSFSGEGSWHATKLFLQRPGIDAEVFFNFDLNSKRGEFSEKDRDYADDILTFMASELRDGPVPAQSPENDARVTLRGPKPGPFRAIAARNARFVRWEGQQRLLYELQEGGATRVASIALEGEPREVEVLRLAHRLGKIQCAQVSNDPCLVQEVQADSQYAIGPRTYSIVERAQKRVTTLSEAWSKEASQARSSVSIDGTVVALRVPAPEQKGRSSGEVLHFVRVEQPGSDVSFGQGDHWLDVLGWLGQGPTLRAVVQQRTVSSTQATSSWLAVDPRTGAQTPLDHLPDNAAFDATISPDGKHRFRCQGAERVVITEIANGHERKFPIAARERHAFAEDCPVQWRGSSYLSYPPIREALIDIETLKLSFPFAEDAELGALEWDPSLTWVIRTDNGQLEIARLTVMP